MTYNKGINSTIKLLNRFGYIVLEIDELFFTVKTFDEASNNSWKHSLNGRDITDIVMNYHSIHSLDDSKRIEITEKIEAIQNCNKFFHKDFKFILHMPS